MKWTSSNDLIGGTRSLGLAACWPLTIDAPLLHTAQPPWVSRCFTSACNAILRVAISGKAIGLGPSRAFRKFVTSYFGLCSTAMVAVGQAGLYRMAKLTYHGLTKRSTSRLAMTIDCNEDYVVPCLSVRHQHRQPLALRADQKERSQHG
jgi:hypothetical protein